MQAYRNRSPWHKFSKPKFYLNEGGTMKKLVSTLLCIALLVAIFAACGGQSSTDTAPTSPAANQENNGQSTESAGSDRSEYVIQILRNPERVAGFERSDQNAVGKVIKDKFNIVIEHIMYTGDLREKQNLMLAAGDFNEIQYMQFDDIVSSYVGAGALLDLEQYKDIMPNFWARYGETQIPLWRLVGNGTLYKWELELPMQGDVDLALNDMFIRADVLERYGWPTPVSTSDWIELLKKAKQDFPEIDGKPTVAITAPFAEPWGLQGIAPVLYEKGGEYLNVGNDGVIFNTKTNQFEDYFKNQYVKESLQCLNTMYREGLLDEECFTDTLDRTIEKANNGTALALWYINWFDVSSIPNERQYVHLPIQSDTQVAEGQKRMISTYTTRDFNSYGITTNARHPERIAELIDWAMSDEGQTLMTNGIEGVHWERDASGKRVMTDLGIQARRAPLGDANKTEGLFIYNFTLAWFNQLASDGQFTDLFAHAEIYDQYFLTERQREAYAGMGWENSKDWWIKNGVLQETGLTGAVRIDSTTDLGRLHQQMTEVRVRWSAKLIMANDDASFENIYQQAMAEYDLLNPDSVINEYNRLYAEAQAQLK